MRNTYKIHLKNGSVIKIKADDIKIKHREGEVITRWELINPNRWVFFLPGDLVAVERLR